MASTEQPQERPVQFDDREDRDDAMAGAVETWIDDLIDEAESARTSEQFQAWLDMQAAFHDYSYRNTLLIKRQYPDATRVAGYGTWQEEFDRQVQEGEQAIWIWAPIITQRCPECENSESYHDRSDCEYDETPPDEWDRGLVGFKPVPVFDISQTEGEPLPELETATTGDAGYLVSRVLEAADSLGVSVQVRSEVAWSYGEASGVCHQLDPMTSQPLVEVVDRANDADLATTLVHEYAHAILHFDVEDEPERAKRELEAEAVAYIVGRHYGLDSSGSAFYLAAWAGEDLDAVRTRLARISSTVEEIIDAIGTSVSTA